MLEAAREPELVAGDRPAVRLRDRVGVLECDGGLADGLPAAERDAAAQAAWARVMAIPRGSWDAPSDPARFRGWLGLLVLEGLLARHVEIGGMGWMELLGPGDLTRPWTRANEAASSLPARSRFEAVERTRLALLDRDFAARIAPWPEIAAALVGRAVERSRRLTYQLAANQPARVEERVWTVLWHLADRFGRVTARGVELRLPNLTHASLAVMLGARRPTISVAVRRLAELGLMTQRRGLWVLHGEPHVGLALLSHP